MVKRNQTRAQRAETKKSKLDLMSEQATQQCELQADEPKVDVTPSIRDNPTDTVEEDSEKRGGNLTPPTIVSTHIVDTHTEKTGQLLPGFETTTTPDRATQTVEQLEDISDDLMLMNSTNVYLPRNVRMELTTFRGEERIDIRQRDSSGCRTKIGVALNLPRFKTMTLYLKELEAALESTLKGLQVDYERHLGGDFYVYVKSPFQCVQIRQKYLKDGQMRYSAFRGISLKCDQFNSLVLLVEIMFSCHPRLAEIVPCIQRPDHTDWKVMSTCTECNPMRWGGEQLE